MTGTAHKEKYFPFLYKFLRIAGLGQFHDPCEKNFKNFSSPLYILYSVVQNVFWTLLFPIVLWLEVPRLFANLDRLMLNLTFSITFTLTFVKLYLVQKNNVKIQEIVYVLEEESMEFCQSSTINNHTVNISKRLTCAVLIFANMTVVGLVVGGIFQAFWYPANFHVIPSNRTLPMPLYLPYVVSSDLVYSITFIYQIFGVIWCGNLVVLINTYMNVIMINAAGRLSNLRYVLEHIRSICVLKLRSETPKGVDFVLGKELNIDVFREDDENEEFWKVEKEVLETYGQTSFDEYLCKSLKQCILHHKTIIECMVKFESIYSYGFLTHIINNLNIICHVMIQISENNIFTIRCGTAIALFLTVVSEFLVQCYAGNELTLQATGISESAYNCQWYSTNRDFRRMLLILMARAQKPVEMTAGKFVTISNATFVNIMKGAYSFFALIRSTKGNTQ